MNGFWDRILGKIAGRGLADRLHIAKLERLCQNSLQGTKTSQDPATEAPNKKPRVILERTCSVAIRPGEVSSRYSRVQFLSDKWVVSAPKVVEAECYPPDISCELPQRNMDIFPECKDAVSGQKESAFPPSPEMVGFGCYRHAKDAGCFRIQDFIMENYFSLYPVVQDGVDRLPGFPGWKELHDELGKMYARNHGPDFWQIKRSIRDIILAAGFWKMVSTKGEPSDLSRAQPKRLGKQRALPNLEALNAGGTIQGPTLYFPKTIPSSGSSGVSMLTSLLRPGDPSQLVIPGPSTVEEMMEELAEEGQEYPAFDDECAIESYTPPGAYQLPAHSPFPPDRSSWGESILQPGIAEQDLAEWENVQYTSDILTPPLPPTLSDPSPSPGAIVEDDSAQKEPKKYELIKVGKRRVFRHIRTRN